MQFLPQEHILVHPDTNAIDKMKFITELITEWTELFTEWTEFITEWTEFIIWPLSGQSLFIYDRQMDCTCSL